MYSRLGLRGHVNTIANKTKYKTIMKINYLSLDQMALMSESSIEIRFQTVSKAASRIYKVFIWRFIIGWLVSSAAFISATHMENIRDVYSVILTFYVFAILSVTVYSAKALARYVHFRNELELMAKLSDLPSEVAVRALWYVETSEKAAAWRDSAIRAGRTLRSFDVEKLQDLHKEDLGEEANRTELVQRLHTCRD